MMQATTLLEKFRDYHFWKASQIFQKVAESGLPDFFDQRGIILTLEKTTDQVCLYNTLGQSLTIDENKNWALLMKN